MKSCRIKIDTMQKSKLSFALLILSNTIFAQLPKTDVYLAEFKNLNSRPEIISLKYLTGFNPNGYNNQPRFFNYDEIYLTTAIDTHQTTEIYHLDVKKNQKYRVTDTEKISEFSPVPVPNGRYFTCVRIEADGVDQSLWKYPLDRSDKGQRLLPDLRNIGYYTWLNKDSVALFLVGSPHTLAIANIKSNKMDVIAENIGRCLKTDNEGNLLFVHKLSSDKWTLKSYDISEKIFTSICQMPAGREDFEILVNGTFVTGDGVYLKIFMPGKDKDWVNIADFSAKGIKNINRISAVRDRIIFTNNK